MKNMEYIPDGLGIKETFLHKSHVELCRVFFSLLSSFVIVVDVFLKLPEQNKTKDFKYF